MNTNTQDEVSDTQDIKDCVVGHRSNDNFFLTLDNATSPKKDNTSETHSFNGDTNSHSRQGGTLTEEAEQYEPEQSNNHSGTAGDDCADVTGDGGGEEGTLVNIDAAIERFRMNTAVRLKPICQVEYIRTFRLFAKSSDISRKTKRDLTGNNGKRLILEFLGTFPKPSWRYRLAMLKTFYISGLGYKEADWPIEPRRDLPRLPGPKPRHAPPDELVKQWHKALENEANPEFKLLWLLIAQHGWRPSDVLAISWEDIEYRDGKPWAVIVLTQKTTSPIIAILAPDVQEALMSYRPITSGTGRLLERLGRYADPYTGLSKAWQDIRKKWNLPKLNPNDLRHWVSNIGDRVKLSKPALAGLMGHDRKAGGWMSDWYNNPRTEAILEEQSEKLSQGPLGVLDPPKVELLGVDQEILELWARYMNDDISSREFGDKAEVIKTRRIRGVLPSKIE